MIDLANPNLSSSGVPPGFLWRTIFVWQDLFSALALVLVIEGILPFLSPAGFRQTMQHAAQIPDKNLRTIGLVAMLAGALLLYFVRSSF